MALFTTKGAIAHRSVRADQDFTGEVCTMTLVYSALMELLEVLKAAGVDERVRIVAQNMYQELIEAEGVIGAGFWEQTQDWTVVYNSLRLRTLSMTAGVLELRIPKLWTGTFFPSLLERRRRLDQALIAVIMQAHLHGEPEGSMIWSVPWAQTQASHSRRCPGSART